MNMTKHHFKITKRPNKQISADDRARGRGHARAFGELLLQIGRQPGTSENAHCVPHHINSNTGFIIMITMLSMINSSTTSNQTTGRASPLDRDSQSPLPPSVAEAKNRSIILKQEDFVKKKEEPARKQQEDVVKKKEKMEKTSSRSGLSCLRDVCQKKRENVGIFPKTGQNFMQ